jgi:hypothetical protein
MAVEIAVIEVQRAIGGWTDHLRSYKVVIDGGVVGRLWPGDSLACDVAPGVHEVFLKLDWGRSEKLNVFLAAGQVAKFHCAPRANLFTDFYWATLGRHRYIRLTRITREDA